jgi:threonine synthase
MPEKFHYTCTHCGEKYPSSEILYLCPSCESLNKPGQPPLGVLKTVYNYDEIKKTVGGNALFDKLYIGRFFPLLPLVSMNTWPSLKVGNTPVYKYNSLGNLELGFDLFLKDDSQNPTFSFKDRASALVSAFAKERGIGAIIAASTGNAGSSLAGICAAQGQQAAIFVPASAPLAKLTQIVMYGARIIPVNGTYDDAFALSVRATKQYGWYNRNTAFNPMTIEGKKTVSLELYHDLGHSIPDRIFVPVGDGVVLSGVYKGFEDLMQLGIIDRMPVMVALQAEGSRNLIDNISREEFRTYGSKTIADSISVDVPNNFYMTIDYLKKYGGEWTTVSDAEILEASSLLARTTGIFSEPAAVAAFAGMLKFRENGKLANGSKNVVLLTGSGLKDLKSVQPLIRLPEPVDPGTDAIEELFLPQRR